MKTERQSMADPPVRGSLPWQRAKVPPGRNIPCLAAVSFLFLHLLPSFLAAQNVTIQGSVRDSSGAVLPNAIIRLYQEDALRAEVYSGADGQFRASVPAGRYRIEITALNFGMLSESLEVGPNMAPLTYQLHLAPVVQTLEVQEEPFQISLEPDRNLTGLVLDDSAIQQLPDDEEELRQLLQDMAGPGAAAVGGAEITTDGFSGGRLPPRDQIREIRINNNPFTAERSRPGRGRVEILTRAGTDALRGSLRFEIRDEALNARNAFADTKPPYQRRDWRGNLSGPLQRERSSFSLFASRSRSEDSDSILATTLEGPLSAAVVRPNTEQEYNGRLQFQLPRNHALSLNFEYGTETSEQEGVGGFTLPERAGTSESSDWNLQLQEVAPLTERLVQETRFAVRHNRSQTRPERLAVAIDVLDAFEGGGATSFNEQRERNLQFASLTSYARGPLALKFGFQGEYRQYETLNRDNFLGTFEFSDLAAYAAGLPTKFTRNSGNPELDMDQLEWGAFVQHDVRFSEQFLLSLGLRYEGQTNLGDDNNLDPRIGFAYGLGKSSVLRGGAGLFHQRLSAGTVQSVMRLDGTRQIQIVIENPSYPDPFAGGGMQTIEPPASIRKTSAALAAPYTVNASISFESRLPRGLFVSVGYDFVRGVHLYRSRNINAPLPGQTGRPDPTRGNILLLESSASSRYHELSLRLEQRLGSSSLGFNYSLSSSYDDTDGALSLPANNYDLSGEWGRSSQFQRHSFFARYNFDLPWRISASTRWRANSGRPYNITTGFDDNGDTNTNDRPAGVTRNTGEGPGLFVVDLGIRKTITFRRAPSGPSAQAGPGGRNQPSQGGRGGGGQNRGRRDPELSFTADVSNLFNRTNFSRYSGVLTSPFFGRANSARAPREIELGIQLNF